MEAVLCFGGCCVWCWGWVGAGDKTSIDLHGVYWGNKNIFEVRRDADTTHRGLSAASSSAPPDSAPAASACSKARARSRASAAACRIRSGRACVRACVCVCVWVERSGPCTTNNPPHPKTNAPPPPSCSRYCPHIPHHPRPPPAAAPRPTPGPAAAAAPAPGRLPAAAPPPRAPPPRTARQSPPAPRPRRCRPRACCCYRCCCCRSPPRSPRTLIQILMLPPPLPPPLLLLPAPPPHPAPRRGPAGRPPRPRDGSPSINDRLLLGVDSRYLAWRHGSRIIVVVFLVRCLCDAWCDWCSTGKFRIRDVHHFGAIDRPTPCQYTQLLAAGCRLASPPSGITSFTSPTAASG